MSESSRAREQATIDQRMPYDEQERCGHCGGHHRSDGCIHAGPSDHESQCHGQRRCPSCKATPETPRGRYA